MGTQQLATFTVADLVFGVAVSDVQEVLRHQPITSIPLAWNGTLGLINLRGEVVTTVDVRKRMALAPALDGEEPMNVVVRLGDDLISLLVDSIGDVAEVSDDQFEAPPETMTPTSRDFVRGAYKLDKCLLLILNTPKLIEFDKPAD